MSLSKNCRAWEDYYFSEQKSNILLLTFTPISNSAPTMLKKRYQTICMVLPLISFYKSHGPTVESICYSLHVFFWNQSVNIFCTDIFLYTALFIWRLILVFIILIIYLVYGLHTPEQLDSILKLLKTYTDFWILQLTYYKYACYES